MDGSLPSWTFNGVSRSKLKLKTFHIFDIKICELVTTVQYGRPV